MGDYEIKGYARRELENINKKEENIEYQFNKKFEKMSKLGNSSKHNLMTVSIFEPIFKEKLNKNIIMNGGRLSGKSKQIYMEAIFYMISHTYHDIIVCRANDNSMRTSSYQELMNLIYELGIEEQFEFSISPLRIKRRGDGGSIYFLGVSGSDTSRTRSFKTKYPVGVIIFEELQQVKGQENLEQALASFRRLLDLHDWRIFLVFNPPAQNAHWINIWAKLKGNDTDYIIIKSSYLDILPFVNDMDLKEIIKMKYFDNERYRNYYLGEATGGYGSIYPMFKKESNVLSYEEMKSKFGNKKIVGMIVGVDSAVSHDSTCFAPMIIFDNGQGCILNIFYHDPKKSVVLSSNQLVELAKSTWWESLCNYYHLYDKSSGRYTIPIVFKVDSAAADMKRELMYNFNSDDGNVIVEAYKKPTILEMISMVGSALSRHSVFVVDYGGYTDWYTNRWIGGENPIVTNLSSLIWNKNQTGYDPIVPNDASDAFTYAVCTFYKNPDNLYWLDSIDRAGYYDVNKARFE